MRISSFRDPMGSLVVEDLCVSRTVNPESRATVNFAKKLHLLFPSWVIATKEESNARLVHPKIAFPTYPYEWAPSQLWHAAVRTLDILKVALENGFTLKDASAYNLLFEHTNPLFIDILSFERLIEHSPFWLAYGQFCRHFVYPLVVYQAVGIESADLFKAFPDGLTLDQANRLHKPSIFKNISLISFLKKIEKKALDCLGFYIKKIDPVKLQKHVLRSLCKRLDTLKPDMKSSHWSRYPKERTHYSKCALAEKRKAVENFLNTYKPFSLLDLGCNRGEYALMAARQGVSVIAVDNDAICIDQLYQEALENQLPLLPLIMNLANPSPRMGFLHAEKSSFQKRIEGSFQAIFCLSIIHHLLLTERIPLPLFFAFLQACKTPLVLLEWIGPQDEKAQELAKFSQDRLGQLERSTFEGIAKTFCSIERYIPLPGTKRALYVLKFTC